MSYADHILRDTITNTFFRRVLYTGKKSQLVIMDIKPGEDIGEEVHDNVEQILFIALGTGQAKLDQEAFNVSDGDVVIVTPGTRHNIINTGEESLKIYTVYVPPNHIDGRVHETKADAAADQADEAFGEAVQ